MDKQRWCSQIWKMRGSRLLWFSGRMQGIRQKEQSIGHTGIFGGEHTSLPASVGMPAQKHATVYD
jgi:hypothetical protein